MELKYRCAGELYTVTLEKKEGGFMVDWGKGERRIDVQAGKPGTLTLSLGGERLRAFFAHHGARNYVFIRGQTFVFEEPKGDAGASAGGGYAEVRDGRCIIEAPMPGKIVKVCVGEGKKVDEGEVLVIVEAMKMEMELSTPKAGRVTAVYVTDQQLVDASQSLIEVDVGEG